MSNPSQTTNRLHFSDLHHGRFEDLVMILLQGMHKWTDWHHDGRAGGDEGVDIRAEEIIDDGSVCYWYIQCRNYQNASKSVLINAVDDAIEKSDTLPDKLLVAVGCDPSFKARKSYENYAKSKGIVTPLLWTGAKLEAMLYNNRPDLLAVFFGYSLKVAKKLQENEVTPQERAKRRKKELIDEKERKAFIFSTEGYQTALKEYKNLIDEIEKLVEINSDIEVGLSFKVERDSGGRQINVHSHSFLLIIEIFLPYGNPSLGTELGVTLIRKVSLFDIHPNTTKEIIKKQRYLFDRNIYGDIGWSECSPRQDRESKITGEFYNTKELAEKEIDDLADRVIKFIKDKYN